jgi:hypothetical protein
MFSVQFTIRWPNHGRPVSSAALIDGSSRSETCDGSINRIEAQVGEARGSGYLQGLSMTILSTANVAARGCLRRGDWCI